MRYIKWLQVAFLVLLCSATEVQSSPVLPGDEAVSSSYGLIEISGGVDMLSSEQLSEISGRQGIQIEEIDTQLSIMNLDANMNGNVLASSTTGLNLVAESAFNGVSGIATVIQNSGNQVIINNALILNLWMD